MSVKVTTLKDHRFFVASAANGVDMGVSVTAAPVSISFRVTAAQARELAAALLLHADRIEPAPVGDAVQRQHDVKLLMAAIADLRIEADLLGNGEQLRSVVREVIARADRIEPKGDGS